MSKFSIEAVFKGIDQVTRPVTKIQKSIGKLGAGMKAGLNDANRAVDGAIRGLRAFGAQAAKVGTVLGVSLGAAAYKIGQAGADFEEAITAVGAVGLQTRDQIADLEKEALRLGATTKFTATEAANAMEIMARAGFSNQEILSGVGGVLNAAAASGLEMAEVSNHVSNVLKGMGLEAAEAGRVADVLTLASSKTNSSIGSLGESMKNLSPVAKQFGISLEDAVGMVALLQDVGLDASEAGTATATMMTKLAKPTASVEKQMKKLGITFKDAEGNMLPPLDIFRQMAAANEKLGGNMDQVAFFADLVGLRGQKAALNLKDLFTSDKGQQLTDALRDAEGSAEAMAKLRMDNLKGDWTLFESAIDGVKVALFDLESGPLRGVVQGFTEWVTANKDLIVGGVQDFIQGIRDNLPKIMEWMQRIGRVVAVFAAIAGVIKLVGLVAAGIAALGNPIVWVLGLVALVAAFWPEIVEQLKLFAKDMEYIWDSFVGWLKGLWEGVVSFFSGVWDGVVSLAKGAFELLGKAVQFYVDFYVGIWKGIVAAFSWIWENVTEGFTLAWDGIVSAVTWYVDNFKAGWEVIGEFFSGLWEGIKATFDGIMDSIVGRIKGVIDLASGAVDAVAGFFGFGDSDKMTAGVAGLGTAEDMDISSPAGRAVAEQTRHFEERVTRNEGRLTIEDRTGRAKLDAPMGSPFSLQQQPSGAL